MAQLPVIPDVYRCVVQGRTQAGTPWTNIWHLRDTLSTPVSGARAQAALLVGGFYVTQTDEWQDFAGAGAFVDSVRVTPLDGISASLVSTITGNGAQAGDAMPPDTSAVLTLRTENRGPRYRGRIYLAGFTEAASDTSGRITSTIVSNIVAAGTELISDCLAIDWEVVVASYVYSTAETVTSVSCDGIWDRQRRRRS